MIQNMTHAARTFVGLSMFVVVLGCSPSAPPATPQQVAAPPPTWQSEHHPVSATLLDGWEKSHLNAPGDTIDQPDKLLMAFLNNSAPLSYIIRLEPDAPLDQLPLDVYFDAVETQYTSAGYELIDESDVEFHNQSFHRLRLRGNGTKGPLCQSIFIHRDGEQLTTIQWTFPLPDGAVAEPPTALQEFDAAVELGRR